MAIAK